VEDICTRGLSIERPGSFYGGAAGAPNRRRSLNQAVKEFAQRMVEDHSKANDRLISLAEADGIAVPDELDRKHKAVRERLEASSGAKFDLAHIRGQVVDHQKTAQLLEHEIGSGQDVELKSFASETLPVVLGHLEMAQNIQAQIAGKTSQPAPSLNRRRGRRTAPGQPDAA
jgi:putative membrane protein